MMKPQYSDFQNLRSHDYRTQNANMQASTVALLQEIYALYNLGLVCVRSAGGNGYVSLLAWHDIIPLGLEFTGLGERFYKLFMGEAFHFPILLLSQKLCVKNEHFDSKFPAPAY